MPKPINLALQGGGAHGAFTWGVLDRLLEDGRVKIEGISGTSAGAMNAVAVADGLMKGGREEARRALEEFWFGIAEMSRSSPIQRTPYDKLMGKWSLDMSPSYMFFDTLTRMFSPYQLNPMNTNPLRDLLQEKIDFERVRCCTDVKLFISATSVRTGKVKIFKTPELTAEAILASACLPFLFQAAMVDGEAYWDGGYMGNPVIYPLIYRCESRDVVIVQINPLYREELPTTAPEILDRVNEISFNSSLMREMRVIAFVTKLLEDEKSLDPKRYKQMLIHRIQADSEMKALGAASKLNAEKDFLVYLRDLGRKATGEWLDRNYNKLGKESTVDIKADYM